MATGKYIDDATVGAIGFTSLDTAADFVVVHDDSDATNPTKRLAWGDLAKRTLTTADISHLTALANLAAIDSANDKFLVWDASATAIKTLTATEIMDRLLTTLDISSLSALTTVESVDPAADSFMVWDASAGVFKVLTASQVVSKLWQGPKVAITTTPQTLTSATSGSLYHNTGAAVAITVNLPAATAGLRYSFARVADYDITLDGNSTETINGSLTYVVSSAGRVDVECFSAGTWTVTGNSTLAIGDGAVNVKSYGATGNGVADDTSAVNAAIAYANAHPGTTIMFPAGTYKVTASLTTITAPNTYIKGAGRGVTTVLMAPAATCIGFNFDQTQDAGGVLDLKIYSTDTSYTKTGIIADDCSNFTIERVDVSLDGGGDSTGLRCYGRELFALKHVFCRAPVPIRLSQNPNASALSLDMSRWDTVYCIAGGADGVSAPSTLTRANVLIDDDVVITGWDVSLLEMAGGVYGVYGSFSGAQPSNSYGIHFGSVRFEQPVNATGYGIYLNWDTSHCDDLVIDTIYLPDTGGIYLRNVYRTSIRAINHPYAREWMNISGARSLRIESHYLHASATSTGLDGDSDGLHFSGMAQTYAGDLYPQPAEWVYQTKSLSSGNYDFSAVRITKTPGGYWFDWHGQLADDCYIDLPINSDRGVSYGWVSVQAIRDSGAVAVTHGDFALHNLHSGAFNYGVYVKASSTASVVNTDTDTNLCLFSVSSTTLDELRVRNRLGYTANISIVGFVKRTLAG